MNLEPIRQKLQNGWAGLLGRVALGGVLVAAGALKVGKPTVSVMAVQAYELLPNSVAIAVGTVLPYAELLLGGLLVTGLATRVAAGASAALMAAFLIGIGSAWARGLSIDCGCFGGGGSVEPGQEKYLAEMLRDTALLGIALALTGGWRHRYSLDAAMRMPEV